MSKILSVFEFQLDILYQKTDEISSKLWLSPELARPRPWSK